MNRVTQDNQIKGECQLRDLGESIDFYNEKCDELEREITERKRRKSMNWKKGQEKWIKIDDLNRVIDSQEQY